MNNISNINPESPHWLKGNEKMATPEGGLLLVVPPFQTIARPALGVSQLKANLQEQGFPTRISYLNFRFAERIGLDLYEWIAESTFNSLLGEFIFSYVLFNHPDEAIEQYVEKVLVGSDTGDELTRLFPHESLSAILRRLTGEAATFCRDVAVQEILAYEPWLVGLTSSFQQNCCSLAIIKAVKQSRPDILTAMGGANCQTEMGEELFQQFAEVDYVGQGECDRSLVNLIQSLRDGTETPSVPGILSRGNGQVALAAPPILGKDLDGLPNPDFADYFAQLTMINDTNRVVPGLVMETSRGCWWGAKQHCTFCGLNGEDMGFRSKSAQRARDEMTALVNQYGASHIAMADNILDMKYFKTFLPGLAEDPIVVGERGSQSEDSGQAIGARPAHPVEIFYETKANLSKPQVNLLARCNIHAIQPGIESLSSQTLKLMRKGTTKIQNIQLLKWCAEFGIGVSWNYLYGFPGEQADELAQIAQDIETIHHLYPPSGANPIRLDRFSPYFNAPGSYGLEPVYPAEPYRHIYPFPTESLKRIAYFYECDFFANTGLSDAFKTCESVTAAWRQAYRRSYLLAVPRKKSLLILDTRSCASQRLHLLAGVRRAVYEFCDKAHTFSHIHNVAGSISEGELKSMLDAFVKAKLMIHSDGQYLSLAVNWRSNCGKVVHGISGGYVRSAKKSKKLPQKLLDVVTFKMPPGEVYTGVVRKTIPHLTKFLAEG